MYLCQIVSVFHLKDRKNFITSEKGSFLKGNNFFPLGGKFFSFKNIHFQTGLGEQAANQEVIIIVSLFKNASTLLQLYETIVAWPQGYKKTFHAQHS